MASAYLKILESFVRVGPTYHEILENFLKVLETALPSTYEPIIVLKVGLSSVIGIQIFSGLASDLVRLWQHDINKLIVWAPQFN